jgi:hypothetical protein
MPTNILQQVRQAVGNLNPNEVRETAERPLVIRLEASSEAGYASMERFFAPAGISPKKRAEVVRALFRADRAAPGRPDVAIYEAGLPAPPEAVPFYPDSPERTVAEILSRHEDLGLPLARYFGPFRAQVVEKVIFTIARENALFSLLTALPNVAPGLLSLPWGIAEMGSDTAFLTVNQIRMLFLLAGASDRPIGYSDQRSEIASVIAGAFGWRALAREVAGKIPFGGGLIPKAAVAFAGTYVVGKSAERLYRVGYGYAREERRAAFQEAFERGKQIAGALWESRRRSSGTRNL